MSRAPSLEAPAQRATTAPRLRAAALRCSGILGFAVLWELASRLRWIDPTFAPALSTVVVTIGRLIASGALLTHICISAGRALAGLALGLLIAVPAGLVLARWTPRARLVLDPFLRVLSQVNPFSLMPVFLLFFGSGELVKITTVGWVAIWPILFYTLTAITTVDPILLKTGRSMALSERELVLRVILPASVPTLFVGLRIAAGLVFFMLIAAEMLGTNGGLGWLVHNSAMNYQIPGIYAGSLLVTLLGFGLHRGLIALERHLSPRAGAALPTVPGARRPAAVAGPAPRPSASAVPTPSRWSAVAEQEST
jgi:NitT/TauT family transport system permease protein